MTSLAEHSFVGRQNELAQLRAAVDAARDGHGQLAMLVGEPGIGKTRLAEVVTAEAEDSGALVAWGRCRQQRGAPSFLPWLSVLGAVRGNGNGGMEAAVSIRDLVPETDGNRSGLQSDSEQEKYRLFQTITDQLFANAEEQPLVAVIDDLHWGDESSIDLLEFLGPVIVDAHVMIIGTYRESELGRRHRLPRALGALNRERHFQRIALSGISVDDTRVLMGSAPPENLVATVHARAEGNPFYIKELVQLVAESSDGGSMDDSALLEIGLPAGVREVISRRVDALSDECRQVLDVASLLGRAVNIRQMDAVVSDLDQLQILEVIEEACAAGTLEESPYTAGAYRFSHSLIAETLVEGMSSTGKLRLQASIAAAMEKFWGTAAESHAAELAEHFAAAEPILGPDAVIRYSVLAGDQAAADYAWETAVQHYDRAVLACETSGGSDSESRLAEILTRMAEAYAALGRLDEIDAAAARAFDLHVSAGAIEDAINVAAGQQTSSAGLVGKALDLVERGSLSEGRLLAWRGFFDGLRGDDEASEEAFDSAAAIAQREDDKQLELQVLTNSGLIDSFAGRSGPDVLRRAERVIDFAIQLEDVAAEFKAHQWAGQTLLVQGIAAEARDHQQACSDIADRLDHLPYRIETFQLASAIEMCVGDIPRLQTLIDNFPGPWNFALPKTRQIEIDLLTGKHDAVVERLNVLNLVREVQRGATQEVRTPVAGEASVAVRLTGLAISLGVEDAPKEAATRMAERVLGRNLLPTAHLIARFGLVMMGASSDSDSVPGMIAAIEPFKGTFNPPFPHVDRILGTLEAARGDFDKAQVLFDSSLAFAEKAGYPIEIALTCLDEVTAAVTCKGSADRARTLSTLDKGLDAASAQGLHGVAQRLESLREEASQLGQTTPKYPDGLTEREVEVLAQLAKGLSNRDIGDELFITENTVIRHVSNIFSKTGVANRGEAGAYAVRQQLVPDGEDERTDD